MKNPTRPDFWNSKEAEAVFRADQVEEAGLHRHLAEIIRGLAPKRLLDFGCGDGALLPTLNPGIEIGLYDPNSASARIAAGKSKSEVTRVYEHVDSIEPSSYDAVVLSFVLVCLGNQQEFAEVLHRIKAYLCEGGTLIVAEAHPCFRDRVFVGHRVDYTDDRPFNYNARFHQFPICLKGENEEVRFYDYHWTLADAVNTIVQSGLKIRTLNEIPDSDFGNRTANPFFPPYLVICATK